MAGPPGIILPTGIRLHIFEALDSTNAEALRRIEAGAQPIEVIWAREQTAGRGRDGRSWVSPPGNLYATFVVRAEPGRPSPQLAFVAALAAGDAILALCAPPCDLRYKWPNDILISGRKAAGILIECSTGKRGHDRLAIGIGINVEHVPDGTAWPATCLRAETGAAVTVEALLERLAETFAARLESWRKEGFPRLRADWMARAFGVGERLSARLPGGAVYDGTFHELDPDGALVLDLGAQGLRSIPAGEVMLAGR